MPTIDELPPAISVSDYDELMVSQTDIARKATRAQILAGVQPALAVAPGTLLGRVSTGNGAPEAIIIGPNLTVANSTISGAPAYNIYGLPSGGTPQSQDLVAVGQGGQNAAVSYGSFVAGITAVPGLDASQFNVTPTAALSSRTLANSLSDLLFVEAFGTVGDGVTDDTAAFQSALARGKPLSLSNKIYIVNGPLACSSTPAIFGVPGATIIRRLQASSSSAWVDVTCASFVAAGIIFDGGGLLTSDAPLLSVQTTCLSCKLFDCGIINSSGPTQGSGLAISAAPFATHVVHRCFASGNAQNGIAFVGGGNLEAKACSLSNNAMSGISISSGATFEIADCSLSGNLVGLSVGDWASGSGAQPPFSSGTISGNSCSRNTQWGIAVSGSNVVLRDNLTSSNGGVNFGGNILARLMNSQVAGNVMSNSPVGLDARICDATVVTGNQLQQCAVGITLGGSQNCLITNNFINGSGWGIVVTAIEPTLSTSISGPISIKGNWIGFSSVQGGGVQVLDGAPGISIIQNDFNGWGSALVDQALRLNASSAIVSGNSWNNQATYSVQAGTVAGIPALVVPDVVDRVLVTSATAPIGALMTCHQADTLGQITFIALTGGGTGYSQAQVTLNGSGGGATATAVVVEGQVGWITVTNPGSGYGSIGAAATVTITGDGDGATAIAFVGLPVLESRHLRISCSTPVQFEVANASPPLSTWTGYNVTIPAGGAAELEGTFGGWRVVESTSYDYLTPDTVGGVVIQSVNQGNLTLRPSAGGALVISNASDPVGCTSSVGHGAPAGVVAAPPGSDYRNLDGGAGTTLWIKQVNTDSTGWVSIA